MAFGLRIKDSAGNTQVQYTDTLPRILGEFDTGTEDGSFAAPAVAGGQPFFFVVGTAMNSSYLNMPVIVPGPNSFSWYFVSAVDRVSIRVAYGRIG